MLRSFCTSFKYRLNPFIGYPFTEKVSHRADKNRARLFLLQLVKTVFMERRIKSCWIRFNLSVLVTDRGFKHGKIIGGSEICIIKGNSLRCRAFYHFVKTAKSIRNFPRIAVFAVVQTPRQGVPSAVAPFYFCLIHFSFPPFLFCLKIQVAFRPIQCIRCCLFRKQHNRGELLSVRRKTPFQAPATRHSL